MPRPLITLSESDSLIQRVDINSDTKWQTVQIQISWLLQKPTDLDLHCLQRQDISMLSRTRVNDAYAMLFFICFFSLIFFTKAYVIGTKNTYNICFYKEVAKSTQPVI